MASRAVAESFFRFFSSLLLLMTLAFWRQLFRTDVGQFGRRWVSVVVEFCLGFRFWFLFLTFSPATRLFSPRGEPFLARAISSLCLLPRPSPSGLSAGIAAVASPSTLGSEPTSATR